VSLHHYTTGKTAMKDHRVHEEEEYGIGLIYSVDMASIVHLVT